MGFFCLICSDKSCILVCGVAYPGQDGQGCIQQNFILRVWYFQMSHMYELHRAEEEIVHLQSRELTSSTLICCTLHFLNTFEDCLQLLSVKVNLLCSDLDWTGLLINNWAYLTLLFWQSSIKYVQNHLEEVLGWKGMVQGK